MTFVQKKKEKIMIEKRCQNRMIKKIEQFEFIKVKDM